MAFNDWLLRLTANFDLKYRFQTAKTFMKANPQLAEESKHDYMRRVHWAVLQTYGLPPLSIVNFWLSSNKPYILAPTDQIERYLIAFHDCVASEVTALDARKYVHGHADWCGDTKNTHNRHLRALFSFLIQNGYATINPFVSVPFVKRTKSEVPSKVISVDSVQRLLQFALDTKHYPECASLALVFFCGVRIDEVERVQWSHIRLDGDAPIADLRQTKVRWRRINEIPRNAIPWLRHCLSTGKVAPNNYEKRMQRLRGKAKIYYPKNAARHCFCSYHVALHQDALKTAHLLGHSDPTLLYSTYRELVTKEDAIRYFEIVPQAVQEEQKLAEERKLIELDNAQRECAEEQSNCGCAVKGEDGQWIPLVNEEFEPPADWREALDQCWASSGR
jgi:integrase